MKNKIIIYTDGAARGNPGKAGWGVVIILGNKVVEIGGASKHATNNQMELIAPIEAFKYLKKTKTNALVEVFSDSKYMILGITEWISNWQKKNWKNAAKNRFIKVHKFERTPCSLRFWGIIDCASCFSRRMLSFSFRSWAAIARARRGFPSTTLQAMRAFQIR